MRVRGITTPLPSPTRGRRQPGAAGSDEGRWGLPPSPRWRGEGRVRGLGPYRESRLCERTPRGVGHCGHVPQAPHPDPLPASGAREKRANITSLRGGEADAAIQGPRMTPGLLRLRLETTTEAANPSPTRGRRWPREARSDEGSWNGSVQSRRAVPVARNRGVYLVLHSAIASRRVRDRFRDRSEVQPQFRNQVIGFLFVIFISKIKPSIFRSNGWILKILLPRRFE